MLSTIDAFFLMVFLCVIAFFVVWFLYGVARNKRGKSYSSDSSWVDIGDWGGGCDGDGGCDGGGGD